MTNRVPPLHPASPPPFSKLNFYEDDVDENDDFANYTIATADIEEKFHRDSPETVENIGAGVDENPICFSPPPIDSPVIEDVPTTSHANDLSTGAETEIGTHNHGPADEMSVENEIRSIGVDERQLIVNASMNCDDVGGVSVFENHTKNDHSDTDDDSSIDSRADKPDTEANGIVFENFSNALNFSPTKEVIPLETSDKNDSVVESSDDSSAIINEAAFIVVENGSDIEGDIFDDGFQEFSNYKTDPSEEINNARPDAFFPFEEADQLKTKNDGEDDQFLSSISKQAADANCRISDLSAATELVTPDDSQIFKSHETTELCTERNEYVELMDENDDFDDFVSPPVYTTHSTEQLPLDSEIHSTVAHESRTSISKEHDTCTYAIDCWSEIFEYSGEDPIEVNLNTLEGKLNGSSIWCQIKNIETSPALKFNWNDSETKKLLLATLGVDLRNILFGPRWNAEVPRFASNLKFSPLVPQKAASDDNLESQHSDSTLEGPTECVNSETVSQTASGVQDAHFDWTSSGLTNPLDARKSDKITKVTTSTVSQMEYELPIAVENTTTNQGLSSEASKILNSLPDLIVMEKQYIVFPIR